MTPLLLAEVMRAPCGEPCFVVHVSCVSVRHVRQPSSRPGGQWVFAPAASRPGSQQLLQWPRPVWRQDQAWTPRSVSAVGSRRCGPSVLPVRSPTPKVQWRRDDDARKIGGAAPDR